MFNLQGSEIVIVLLLALVVLGPEKLPDAMRKMGQFYAELKKMSSGFQSEFRAAVDEPMREIRDTANVLRDSADFTKLQQGERSEKPKSAEMLAPADDDAEPSEVIPTFETAPSDTETEPELAADSRPAPFAGVSSSAPREPAAPAPEAADGNEPHVADASDASDAAEGADGPAAVAPEPDEPGETEDPTGPTR